MCALMSKLLSNTSAIVFFGTKTWGGGSAPPISVWRAAPPPCPPTPPPMRYVNIHNYLISPFVGEIQRFS